MRTCTKCGIPKELPMFPKRFDSADGYNKQCRRCLNLKTVAWQQRNKEKVKAAKHAYMQSEEGKEAKKRWDTAFKASGKRDVIEAKRSLRPISEARKQARKRWALANATYFAANRALRRAKTGLSAFDIFVAQEAFLLAKLRQQKTGTAWHVDHIIPVSKGGTNHANNLQVVPAVWNRKKSNRNANRFIGA